MGYVKIAGEKGYMAEVNSAGKLKVDNDDILSALYLATEANVDAGTATGGTQTTVIDTAKNWQTDIWKNALIEVVISGVHYIRFASGNTSNTITISALPAAVVVAAGNTYQCKIPVHVQDIERWGNTTLTGRDISLDLKKLYDALTVSSYTSGADAASGVIKAAAGTLQGLSGYNAKTSEQYLQIFNSAAVPADGVAPAIVIKLLREATFSLELGELTGYTCSAGISWSNSSTRVTKTIGAADVWLNAAYK